MARTILVAGTASHVGKSTVATGLCRLFAERGVDVAPFKAQNMSNNARVVVRGAIDETPVPASTGRTNPEDSVSDDRRSTDDVWGEIGISQFVQARGARITPTTDHNPVLLKPRGERESQLVIDGRAVTHLEAGTYYEDHWEQARTAARRAHERLAADHDVVVAEGAGSIAEINLHDRDLANVETARFADAEILLCVDIERGGAFASLYGTIELLPADIRERVAGAIVTKFRGDPDLLESGIDRIEEETGVPVVGVLPYEDPGLPAEDSVGLPATTESALRGTNDGVDDGHRITIGVPRLPHLSNAGDVEALEAVPGVSIRYEPVRGRGGTEAGGGEQRRERVEQRPSAGDQFCDVDAIVIPGTKNTADDLLALHDAGLVDPIRRFEGPIVGICGGYQLLGRRLDAASREGTGDRDQIEGIGRLPVETTFGVSKTVRRTSIPIQETKTPLLEGVSETVSGYEIHTGKTRCLRACPEPLEPGSVVVRSAWNPRSEEIEFATTGRDGEAREFGGPVLGTYLHGLFENEDVRDAFVAAVYEYAETDRIVTDTKPGVSGVSTSNDPYDDAAGLLSTHVDFGPTGLDLDSVGGERSGSGCDGR